MSTPFKNAVLALSLALVAVPIHAAEARCSVSAEVASQIRANTFMIVPINMYASAMPEARAREYVEKNCGLATLPLSEKLNCQALQDCQGEACVRPYASHGTAFLQEDGRTLVTAWHVVFQTQGAALTLLADRISLMTPEEKTGIYRNLVPEFILVNHQDQIVYDTRQPAGANTRFRTFSDPLSTVFAERGQKNGQPFGYYENIADELAVIDLQQTLGTGLPMARQTSVECITSAGFGYDSVSTKFSIVSGAPSTLSGLKRALGVFMDFQIKSLPQSRASIEALPTAEVLMVMGYSAEQAAAQVRDYSEEQLRDAIRVILDTQARHARDLAVSQGAHSVYFDGQVLSGFSGGPILNTQGEIMGITTNAFLKKDETSGRQMSVGGAGLLLTR